MRIFTRKKLREFGERYPDAKKTLDIWWVEAKRADWGMPADIKALYGSASILKGSRVVFNICGNKYRLVVKFRYEKGAGYIRFLGTHNEYDQINAEEI